MHPPRLFFLAMMVTMLGCNPQQTDTTPGSTSETTSSTPAPGHSTIDPDTYVQQALEELRIQTETHKSTWGLGEADNWAADLETGRITFTFADGTVAAADIQVVGTYATTDGTFLWGWDHPSVAEPLSKHAALARQFGIDHNLPLYTERKVECTEDQAWEFTAVAARLGEASGAYRGPAGSALVFMTFGEVKLTKP
jgi:hypothetical protein